MCKFASFVLTKDREFWSEKSDSHASIIEENGLNEWGIKGPNIVKVEISPSAAVKVWPSLKSWTYAVDQDKFPEWYDAADCEARTREALTRRFKGWTAKKTPKFSGDLDLYGTQITSLPADLTVGGSLYLGSTPITSLPADLTVGGNLDLGNTQITSLPADLTVGGDLYLSNTPITSLPADLTVGGGLYLYGTQITEVPEKFKDKVI
jgi:Leucine-rich repeat (LRR) protein